MWNSCGGWGHGFMFGGPFFQLWWFVFAAVVLVVIVLLFLRISRTHSLFSSSPDIDAMEILKRRYAKGKIDEAEFSQKKSQLSTDQTQK